jgi:hypothetical protein
MENGLSATGWKDVKWISQAQGKDTWWALVSSVMNFQAS